MIDCPMCGGSGHVEDGRSYREMRDMFNDALDIIIWMSGSPSFSPQGEAHKGWLKFRPRVHQMLASIQKGQP